MKDDCLFCKIANKKAEGKIIYEDDLVVACLDAYPNVSGHTLIIPKKHYEDFLELPDELVVHINQVCKKLGPILMKKMEKNGLTCLYNYGDAQVIKHFHMHIKPLNFKKKEERILSSEEVYKILGKTK